MTGCVRGSARGRGRATEPTVDVIDSQSIGADSRSYDCGKRINELKITAASGMPWSTRSACCWA